MSFGNNWLKLVAFQKHHSKRHCGRATGADDAALQCHNGRLRIIVNPSVAR
jgi:hypothetical protein